MALTRQERMITLLPPPEYAAACGVPILLGQTGDAMNCSIRLRAGLFALVCVAAAVPALATQEKILYTFTGLPAGAVPLGTLISDKAGNLYGTTEQGGTGLCTQGGGNAGCGTIFELSPPSGKTGSWSETILYSFQAGADGSIPMAGLVFDGQGNLYGTTSATNSFGQGTVFELSPPTSSGAPWSFSTLHTFKGSDGAGPTGTLIFDRSGNLYGTTGNGGYYSGTLCVSSGCGTVFELSPPSAPGGAWTETVLHAFTASHDGAYPRAGLAIDQAGDLFGTTTEGGNTGKKCDGLSGCGTVFELQYSAGAWTEHILHRFDYTDGARPFSTLVLSKGAIYGTTSEAENYGSIFELTSSAGQWTLSSIFTFNENDGSFPLSGVTVDAAGNLFGTTDGGPDDGSYGNVYKLSPPATSGEAWSQTILHNFTAGKDSSGPQAGLLQGGSVLYGTASGCISSQCTGGYGTVFAVTK